MDTSEKVPVGGLIVAVLQHLECSRILGREPCGKKGERGETL